MPRAAIGVSAGAITQTEILPAPEDLICVPGASLSQLMHASPRCGNLINSRMYLARSEGFEPPTPRFEVMCSTFCQVLGRREKCLCRRATLLILKEFP